MRFSEIINDQQLATEAIRRWITTAVCVVVALLTADWIASGRYFMLTLMAGLAITAFVTTGMQRSAWILIAIGWSFQGSIQALPIPMTTHDVIVLVVTFAYVAQRVVGHATRRSKGVLGALVAINCLYVASTYLFHPVGVRALGSETLGGRPYFDVFIAACAYWVLVHLPESYSQVTKIPMWLVVGVTVSAAISAIVYIFPSITPIVWYFASDVDISEYVHGALHPTEAGPEVQRFGALAPFGVTFIQFMAAYFPPGKFLNPGRWQFYLFLLGLVAILVSGFRNSLAFALASVALAAWFHRGMRQIILAGLLGVIVIGLMCYGQGRLFDLPLNVQRTLGSLPGQWNQEIKDQISDSNARFQWWEQLIQEGFVKNWWIGDGFGISESDFDLIAGGTVGFREAATATGSFHSGPLTTIRFVGIVGLVLFYALMIGSAIYSVKLVNRCRNTPLFPASVFLAVQLVWTPIHFTVLFGSYNHALTNQLFMAGLLTLIWNMTERQPPAARPAPTARPFYSNNRATPVPL